jgi:hypothetical protein
MQRPGPQHQVAAPLDQPPVGFAEGRRRTVALRASVGSTEAANEVVARFGVIDV